MTNRRKLGGIFLIAFLQNLAMTAAGGIIPIYLKVLGASELLIGISYAWFSLVRGSSSLISGQFADRFGRRHLLGLSLAGFALANLAYALAASPGQIAALRVLQGLAAGLYWVVILCMVAEASAPQERLRNLTWFNIVMALSGVGANWVGGYLAENISPRFVFWQGFAIFICTTLFALWFFRSEPAPKAAKAEASKFSWAALLNVSNQVKLLSLLASIGMIAETVTSMGMSLYVYGAGGGYQDVGLIAGLIVACGVLCQLLAPTLQQKLGYQGIILLVYGCNAVLLFLLFWGESLAAAYWLFPMVGGLFTLTSLTWLTLAQGAATQGQIGSATGFFRGTLDLASVVYYLAFGALSARLTVVPLLLVAAVILLALAIVAQRVPLEQPQAGTEAKRRAKTAV